MLEWPFSLNWLAKPHKCLSTCYGQLGSNGAPSRGGHQWVKPSPIIFPNNHFVIHGWRSSAEEGTGEGGDAAEPKTDTNGCTHRHSLPTQARMQIPSPSQNASVGIICEQKSSRRAVSASLLSLSAPPAWRQPRESPSYLLAASAEANRSTMDPIGQGQSFSPPYHQPFSPPSSPGVLNKEVASSVGRRRRRRRGEI